MTPADSPNPGPGTPTEGTRSNLLDLAGWGKMGEATIEAAARPGRMILAVAGCAPALIDQVATAPGHQ